MTPPPKYHPRVCFDCSPALKVRAKRVARAAGHRSLVAWVAHTVQQAVERGERRQKLKGASS